MSPITTIDHQMSMRCHAALIWCLSENRHSSHNYDGGQDRIQPQTHHPRIHRCPSVKPLNGQFPSNPRCRVYNNQVWNAQKAAEISAENPGDFCSGKASQALSFCCQRIKTHNQCLQSIPSRQTPCRQAALALLSPFSARPLKAVPGPAMPDKSGQGIIPAKVL